MSSEGHNGGGPGMAPIEVYPGPTPLVPGRFRGALHLAIGMFDGVHPGHQRVIGEAVSLARARGHWSAVLTFDPHPARLLRPEAAPKLLMPLDERVEALLGLGLNHVFVHPFTIAFSRLEAEAFVTYLREIFPTLESLHVGENFRFGAGRRGDGPFLRQLSADAEIAVFVHAPLCLDGGCVSSSRIREAIETGRMGEAASLLGRAHRVRGTVVPGRQIGRQLGIPTLNVPWYWELCPPFGVYAIGCRPKGCKDWIPAIANLGVRPTFGADHPPVLEVHLLTRPVGALPVAGDLIEVEFGRFIRPEMTFTDSASLRSQIRADIDEAARLHGVSPAGLSLQEDPQ